MPGKEAVSLILCTSLSNEGPGIVVHTQRQSLDADNAKPGLYRKKVILVRKGKMGSIWKLERRGVGLKRIEVEIPTTRSHSTQTTHMVPPFCCLTWRPDPPWYMKNYLIFPSQQPKNNSSTRFGRRERVENIQKVSTPHALSTLDTPMNP